MLRSNLQLVNKGLVFVIVLAFWQKPDLGSVQSWPVGSALQLLESYEPAKRA